MARKPKQETPDRPWAFADHPAAEAEFDGLPADLQARLFDRLTAAAITGFNLLRAPIAETVAGLKGVVEIRERGESGEAAAYVVTRPRRRAVIVGYLHKSSAEAPRRMLTKIGRRAAEAG